MNDAPIPDRDLPDQLPARMLNEFAYCPRLFHLEYVQGEWAHSVDTLDGRFVHRRVDRHKGSAPTPDALTEETRIHARSITVGSTTLGAIACIDVLEGEGDLVTPVDYKRGSPPDIPEGAWEPERVQVCLQGLLLRENGYRCEGGVLYFAKAKMRVEVAFTEALVARTLELLEAARRAALEREAPPPLLDSPKCPRCSLAGICLPDEVHFLQRAGAAERAVGPWGHPGAVPGAAVMSGLRREADGPVVRGEGTEADRPVVRGGGTEADRPAVRGGGAEADGAAVRGADAEAERAAVREADAEAEAPAVTGVESDKGGAARDAQREAGRGEPRRLTPARDDRMPLYVQGQGYSLGLSGEVLEVREKGKKVDEVRLMDLSQVSLFGNVQLSAQALRELVGRDIVVAHLSYGGWLNAVTTPPPHKNIEVRRRQFEAAGDPERCLRLARAMVTGKIRNCRTLLRRNARALPEEVLQALARTRREAEEAESLSSLLGIEGNAARIYFGVFSAMFKATDGELPAFDFQTRNRRPPRDPVNAMLSFLYAMLVKDLVGTIVGVGLDPYMGFYHQPRYGRPALALDLMEEFRPLVADSVVIGLINNGEVQPGDFVRRAGACALTDGGRRRVLEAYERRMDGLVTHPIFGYTLSYRRVLEVQVRLLSRYLTGEIDAYPPFCTR